MKFLKRINPKYIFFSIFILCLAFLDVFRDILLPGSTGEKQETLRWWWHAIKIFGNCNVAMIFLWDDIMEWLFTSQKPSKQYFMRYIFYPALWLMLIAFGLQVIPYNWLFGMVR